MGLDVASTWRSLVAGKSGIARIRGFDPSDLGTQIAGEVHGFDPLTRLDRKEVRRSDRFAQLAVAAAAEAIADAGLDVEEAGRHTGVAIATAAGGVQSLVDAATTLRERGADRVSPFFITQFMPNSASAIVAMKWGLRGPNFSHVAACASGTHSVGESAAMIKRGQADVMIAGGADAPVVPVIMAAFSNMRALSRRNAEPTRASRPFDLNRDGFIISEGAAVLVLEEGQRAARRGARVYGEVLGYGASDDAHNFFDPAPDGAGTAMSMRGALQDAGIEPGLVQYLNAHGTSTPANDRAETYAIKDVFGLHARNLMVSSTKSMTGHLFGAAGALEAIACLLALTEGCIPPTINYETPDPELDLDYVPNTARRARISVALSNSMGLGGTNASLIFRGV